MTSIDLKGKGTPPLCDALPFKINIKIDFLFIDDLTTFQLAQSAKGYTSHLWVVGSSYAPVLLFIPFAKF